MGSLTPPADSLFCAIRQTWVKALPEEKIRQDLIHFMINELGYPRSTIALEKNLNQLPHLQTTPLPNRRVDLIVLAKNIHPSYPLYPLLLVECKAVPLTPKALRQIFGYHQFVKSFFLAAVNQTDAYIGWYDTHNQDFTFQEGILSYAALLSQLPSLPITFCQGNQKNGKIKA